MENLKYVEVVVDEDILIMTFLGNEGVDRDDFLDETLYFLFLWFNNNAHMPLKAIGEMI